MPRPPVAKPAWHRTPCLDCGRPLIFRKMAGQFYRPHSETRRWNYEWEARCKCGFEAKATTPGGPVYGDPRRPNDATGDQTDDKEQPR